MKMHSSEVPTKPFVAWNKGKVTGQKPPLKPREVWAIRVRLQVANRVRDLALFNLAIDSNVNGARKWGHLAFEKGAKRCSKSKPLSSRRAHGKGPRVRQSGV